MEIVIKFYNDKPSRIAVKFIYEYQATKAYEEILSRHRDESFKIKIEILGNKINLNLISDHNGHKFPYPNLEYKQEHLTRLYDALSTARTFQFAHVFPKENNLFVAKAFNKQEFITVSRLEIVSAENIGNSP